MTPLINKLHNTLGTIDSGVLTSPFHTGSVWKVFTLRNTFMNFEALTLRNLEDSSL